MKELPEGPTWAHARIWGELEGILAAPAVLPNTAVLPNPWLKKVTPKDARAALRRLLEPAAKRRHEMKTGGSSKPPSSAGAG